MRITARNPRGKKAVRSTTVQVSRARARSRDCGRRTASRSRAPYTFGGAATRASAPRAPATRTRARTSPAAEGTPLVAVATGTITWRAYQAGGAGYYLVLDADGEDYNYVYMHLQQGSLLVSQGRPRRAPASSIANVGNTGGSEGPHLHFEVWDGPWYAAATPSTRCRS